MPANRPPPTPDRVTAALLLRYAAAGVVNTVVGLGIIAMLDFGLGVTPWLANAVGYGVGLIVAFTLNRRFVFRRATNRMIAMRRFLLAFGGSFLLNQLVLAELLRLLPPVPIAAVVAQVAGVATYTTVMFLLSLKWVFAEPRAGAAHS